VRASFATCACTDVCCAERARNTPYRRISKLGTPKRSHDTLKSRISSPNESAASSRFRILSAAKLGPRNCGPLCVQADYFGMGSDALAIEQPGQFHELATNQPSGLVNAVTRVHPYVRRGSTPRKDRGRTAVSRNRLTSEHVSTPRESDPVHHLFETWISAQGLKERN